MDLKFASFRGTGRSEFQIFKPHWIQEFLVTLMNRTFDPTLPQNATNVRFGSLASDLFSMWFGEELLPHVQAMDRTLDQGLGYNLGVAGRGGGSDSQRIGEFLNRSEALHAGLTGAIHPYIAAGRRGLPYFRRLALWLRRPSGPA